MSTKTLALSLPEAEAKTLIASRNLARICQTYGVVITTEPHNNPGWVFVMVEADTERQAWLAKGFMIAMNDFELVGKG